MVQATRPDLTRLPLSSDRAISSTIDLFDTDIRACHSPAPKPRLPFHHAWKTSLEHTRRVLCGSLSLRLLCFPQVPALPRRQISAQRVTFSERPSLSASPPPVCLSLLLWFVLSPSETPLPRPTASLFDNLSVSLFLPPGFELMIREGVACLVHCWVSRG